MTADRPTELQCEQTIIEACRVLNYRVHGERPALNRRDRWSTPIKGDPGWPDLVITGHGHVIAAELKRKPNKVTVDQQAWLDALSLAGVETHVVYVPEGMASFLAMLTAYAQPRVITDGYKRARGAVKGTLPAEVAIRRGRGGATT